MPLALSSGCAQIASFSSLCLPPACPLPALFPLPKALWFPGLSFLSFALPLCLYRLLSLFPEIDCCGGLLQQRSLKPSAHLISCFCSSVISTRGRLRARVAAICDILAPSRCAGSPPLRAVFDWLDSRTVVPSAGKKSPVRHTNPVSTVRVSMISIRMIIGINL